MRETNELLQGVVPFHELDCVGLRVVLETLGARAAIEGGAPCRVRWDLQAQLDDQLEAVLLEMAREVFALIDSGLSLRLSERGGMMRFDVQYDTVGDPSFAAVLFARLAELSSPFDGRMRLESHPARGALLRVIIPCRIETV